MLQTCFAVRVVKNNTGFAARGVCRASGCRAPGGLCIDTLWVRYESGTILLMEGIVEKQRPERARQRRGSEVAAHCRQVVNALGMGMAS